MSERKIAANGYQPTPLQVTILRHARFSLVDPDDHMLSFGQDEVESRQ
jgi:hypothetical protein